MIFFGTDGLRGKAFSELTLEVAYKVGLAIEYFDQDVIIGIDTRESSYELLCAIHEGIKKVSVFYVGIIPTPGLQYLSDVKKCIGVMITASHNTYQDNGIKIFEHGEKINETKKRYIEAVISKEIKYGAINRKTYEIDKELKNVYYDYLKFNKPKTKLKICIDGANGACYEALLKLYKRDMLINVSPNGKNINENCGSTHINVLKNYIIQKQYDFGFALDGDGDRLIAVDKSGMIIDGDILIYIFACNLQKSNELKSKTVVFSELVNPGILERLEEIGLSYIITPVGDQNVTNALRNGYNLGGEKSGHIINKTISNFSDGILNMYELIKILNCSEKNIHSYINELKLYAEKEMKFINPPKDILAKRKIIKIIKKYNKEGYKLIIRYSGTENALRLHYYQKTEKGFQHNLCKIRKAIENVTRISK